MLGGKSIYGVVVEGSSRPLRLNHETYGFTIVVDHPLDAVAENDDVEIDQQSDRNVQKTKVGEELSVVNRMEGVFTFGLDHDSILHDQIGSKSAIKFYAVINKRYCLLSLNFQAQL